MQKTIQNDALFSGIGLHSGSTAQVVVRAAAPGTGVQFRRGSVLIPAMFSQVENSPLCTLLRGPSSLTVSTVEHFMAAVWALGIDNLIVDISGEEMPIMDGSALPFLRGLSEAGIRSQDVPRRVFRVSKAVEYREGESVSRLVPGDGFSADIGIDFPHPAIGRQRASFDGTFDAFVSEFSMTRTFCMEADVASMQASGRALGGSLDNAVVFDGDRVLNDGGLRIENEPVRHKMLDVIGDLALLGGSIVGRFQAERPGHRMTNLLLRKAVREGAFYDTLTGAQLVPTDRELIAA